MRQSLTTHGPHTSHDLNKESPFRRTRRVPLLPFSNATLDDSSPKLFMMLKLCPPWCLPWRPLWPAWVSTAASTSITVRSRARITFMTEDHNLFEGKNRKNRTCQYRISVGDMVSAQTQRRGELSLLFLVVVVNSSIFTNYGSPEDRKMKCNVSSVPFSQQEQLSASV